MVFAAFTAFGIWHLSFGICAFGICAFGIWHLCVCAFVHLAFVHLAFGISVSIDVC